MVAESIDRVASRARSKFCDVIGRSEKRREVRSRTDIFNYAKYIELWSFVLHGFVRHDFLTFLSLRRDIQDKVKRKGIRLTCLDKIFATLHDRTTGPAANLNLIITAETCENIPILCINNSGTRSATIYLIPHVHSVA